MSMSQSLSHRSSRAVLARAIAAALMATPLVAVASGDAPGGDGDGAPSVVALDQVMVTAQKRQESINEVPMTISAISREQLRERGGNDLAAVASQTPGMTLTPSPYATQTISIRGIGFNEFSLGARQTVSAYVDELPPSFAVMAPVAMLDMDRVEVLKGPQGTLFGQNSTGGAINVIASKPTAESNGSLDVSYDRFGLFTGEVAHGGALGERLNGRIAFKTEQGGDWQRSFTRNDELGAMNRNTWRGQLEWTPAEDWTVLGSYSGFIDRSDNQAAQYRYFTPYNATASQTYVPQLGLHPFAPDDPRAADWSPHMRPERDNSLHVAGLRVEHTLSDALTLTSLTGYSRYKEDNTVDPDGLTLDVYSKRVVGDIHSLSQELRLTADHGAARWIIGANYAGDRVRQTDIPDFTHNSNAYALVGFGSAYESTHDKSSQDIRSWAVFGNLDVDFSERWTAHVGARYTDYRNKFRGCTADPGDGVLAGLFTGFANFVRVGGLGLPAIAPLGAGDCITLDANYEPGWATRTLDEDNVSWRAGLDFKPSDDSLIYASVSRGYKAGGFPLLPASAADQFDPVVQEAVLAWELGFKLSLAQRSVQLNGAVFRYDYDDKQVRARTSVPLFGQLERLINVPESRVNGAEISLAWRPMLGLDIQAGYTWVDSKVLRARSGVFGSDGLPIDFTGDAFPLTPQRQGVLDVGYSWELSNGLQPFVGANVSTRSDTRSGFGHDARYAVPGYSLLDLRAGVSAADGSWRAWVWGRNVTDREYWINADRVGDTSVRFAGRPATWGGSLSWHW